MLRWPVRHLLLAAVALMKRVARESYQFDMVLWALMAPHSKNKIPAPTPPPILKDIIRGDA